MAERKCGANPGLAHMTVIGAFGLFGLSFFLKADGANEKVLFMVIGALSSYCFNGGNILFW